MTRKEAKLKIKTLLKDLSAKQKEEKTLLRTPHHKLKVRAGDLMYRTFRRAVEITAVLNFYHEIRGHAHMHNIREGWECTHGSRIKKLREEFEIEEVELVKIS